MIRVYIVAASPLARAGLETVLTARGVQVVGSSADMESLADEFSDSKPDVVLVQAPSGQYESVLESVVRSELASEGAVLVLADGGPPAWPAQALRAGVRGVLPGDLSPDQLLAALEAAASGLLILHPTDVDALLPELRPASGPLAELAEPLTRREREVLQMLAGGLGNKEIASRLAISEHTVKFHVASILGKLGAGSRTEAVSLGIRRGLVLL